MSDKIDLTGQRFGRLLVIGEAGRTPNGNTLWECACDCGKRSIVRAASLRRGSTTSCGCYRAEWCGERNRTLRLSAAENGAKLRVDAKRLNIGQRFNRLVVVGEMIRGQGPLSCRCQCDCGTVITAQVGNLRRGNTKSCGCLNRETLIRKATKHGRTKTSAYWRWRAMIQRCTNPKAFAYADYGGRGIKVCARWRTFTAFYADMGEPPAGMSLDRINVDGDYCPENCRWATSVVQARNKRTTPILTYEGRSQSISDWAEDIGIDMHTLHSRLRRGWSVEATLTTAVRAK